MAYSRFRFLYTDIGGVLGTNGWDTNLRRKLTSHFDIDFDSIEPRHHLVFDSYERGFMSFEDYLRQVFFDRSRPFTLEAVRNYTYEQSTPWPENIEFFKRVKTVNRMKMGLISNEGGGITEYRVNRFGLRELADFMVISHFVHLRKPDHAIWHLALNLAQATPDLSIYVDDREMFVNVARELGFTGVHHVSLESTREQFRELGCEVD
jgi:putative hydrolase of the HAD superfamily